MRSMKRPTKDENRLRITFPRTLNGDLLSRKDSMPAQREMFLTTSWADVLAPISQFPSLIGHFQRPSAIWHLD